MDFPFQTQGICDNKPSGWLVADMKVDMVPDMKVDMVADMKVDYLLGISL